MKRIVILFFLSIVVFTGTNYAIEADMYGNFSVLTFWERPHRFDYDSVGQWQDSAWNWHPIYEGDSVELMLNDWLPTGKLGIKFKMGQFGACIEFGVGKNAFDARMTGTNTTRYLYQRYGFYITAEKWYTEWLMNDYFSLLLGQEYTPANFYSSNRLLGPQIGYANMGCLFIGSRPMFQLGISGKDNIVEAKIAAIKVDTQTILIKHQLVKKYVNEVKAPKVEGSVQFNKDFSELFGLKAKAAGGFQKYTTFQYPDVSIIDPVKGDFSFDINSYLVAGELSLRIWRVTLLYSMFHGQNLGPYGIKIGTPSTFWRLNDYKYAKMYYPSHERDTIMVDTLTMVEDTIWSFYDSKVTEISLILNWKLFDFLSIEGGFQEMFGDHEYKNFDELWLDRSNYSWYGQIMFTLFEYMKLTAEGGFTKYGKYKGFGKFAYGGLGLGVEF